jgi:hypothetical protein
VSPDVHGLEDTPPPASRGSTFAYRWRQHRRTKVPAQATFRVEDGHLSITNAGGWDLVETTHASSS